MDMEVLQNKIDTLSPYSANNSVASGEHHTAEIKKEKEVALDEKRLEKISERVNVQLKEYDRRLEYRLHEKTNELIIKVIDTTDNSVVREIPSEKLLDYVASIKDKIGINLDERR